MSPVYAIAGMLAIIALGICYIFIRQTLLKKKQEKARLIRALSKRASDLIQMVNGFPDNFLGRDLSVLLFRNIVDVFEQLSQLDSNETQYIENFKFYTKKMEEAQKISKTQEAAATILSGSQINETRQYLNFLNRFLQKWAQRGNISQKQHSVYKDQIQKLNAQLKVDSYMMMAAQARETEKPKLAIHYYQLAKNLITEEGLSNVKQRQLMSIEETLPRLMAEMEQQAQSQPEKENTESPEDEGWAEYEEEEESWKKKRVYD